MTGFLRRPELHGLIVRWQREADAQASKWIERELIKLFKREQPFGGNEPRITYAGRDRLATISHAGTHVRHKTPGPRATP